MATIFNRVLFIVCAVFLPGLYLQAEIITFKDKSTLQATILKKSEKLVVLQISPLQIPVYAKHIRQISASVPLPVLSPEKQERLKHLMSIATKEKWTTISQELKEMGPGILPHLEPKLYLKNTVYTPKRMLELLESWKNAECISWAVPYITADEFSTSMQAFKVISSAQNLASVHIMTGLLLKGALPIPILQAFKKMPKIKEEIVDILLEHASNMKEWEKSFFMVMAQIKSPKVVAFFDKIMKEKAKQSKSNILAAIFAIGNMKSEEAISLLSPLLSEEDHEIVKQVILSLGTNERERGIPILLDFLRNINSDSELTSNVYWSLEKISGAKIQRDLDSWENWWNHVKTNRETLEAIYAELRTNQDDKVVAALEKMSGLAGKETLNIVVEYLQDSSAKVRQAACRTLSKFSIYAMSAIPNLIECLQDSDPSVAVHAHSTLKQLTHWPLPFDYAIWKQWWEAYQSENSDALIELVTDPIAEMQQMAIVELRKRGETKSIPALMKLLENTDKKNPKNNSIIVTAILTLRQLYAKEAFPILLEYLHHTDPEVQNAAHITLRLITNKNFSLDYDAWKNWMEQETTKK